MMIKMKGCMEKYSVITTTFNDEDTITRYLNNMASQSIPPQEIVIADGGSTDNTLALINQFTDKTNITIKLLSGAKLNIAQGLNCAIRHSSEHYVAITTLGNDYPHDFMEKLLAKLDESIDVTYSPIRGWEHNDFSKTYNKVYLGDEKVMNMPSNHGAMVCVDVFKEHGFFFENFVYAGEDWEYYKNFLRRGGKCVCAEDTYLIWDTPDTIEAYKKQKKAYLIGKLQSTTNTYFFMHSLNDLFIMVLWALFLLSAIWGKTFFSLLILILILFVIGYFMIKYGFKGMLLKVYGTILDYYYFLRSLKYLLYKNKIEKRRLIQ